MAGQHPIRPAQRILLQLKTKGPLSAAQMARRLAVTAMAVRLHLYRLQREGLVDFADERRRVGRPARIWRLTAAAADRFPDNHRELTLGVLQAARSVFGEEGLHRLLAERTKRQLEEYRERMPRPGADLPRKVAALASIRTAQGYMADWSREKDGSLLLVENHCPICAAAKSCQMVCGEELALFNTVLGKEVKVERSEHALAGARRCAYRITKSA